MQLKFSNYPEFQTVITILRICMQIPMFENIIKKVEPP